MKSVTVSDFVYPVLEFLCNMGVLLKFEITTVFIQCTFSFTFSIAVTCIKCKYFVHKLHLISCSNPI